MLKVDRQYQESSIETDLLSKEWNEDYMYPYSTSVDHTISSSWSIISSNKYLCQSIIINNHHSELDSFPNNSHNYNYTNNYTNNHNHTHQNDHNHTHQNDHNHTLSNINDNYEIIPSPDDITTDIKNDISYYPAHPINPIAIKHTLTRLFPSRDDKDSNTFDDNRKPTIDQPRPSSKSSSSTYDMVLSKSSDSRQSFSADHHYDSMNNSSSELDLEDSVTIEDSLLVVMIDKSSIERYQELFDSIQDRVCVDGVTVRQIWSKSNLPKQILCQIWSECDPLKHGYLDRNGFIKGMGYIDTLLAKQNKI